MYMYFKRAFIHIKRERRERKEKEDRDKIKYEILTTLFDVTLLD